MRTRVVRFLSAVGFLGVLVSGLWAAAAVAAPTSPTTPVAAASSPVGFTVSWPAVYPPVLADPGQPTSSYFEVTDNEKTPVQIQVQEGDAAPENNGVLVVKPGAGGVFGGNVTYSPQEFTVQPGGTQVVNVDVNVPSSAAPGTYILAFIVRPVITGSQIRVVNQVNAIVTFQVPGGSCLVKPSALWQTPGRSVFGLPRLQLGVSGHATLKVTDRCSSTVFSYNEITGTSTPWGKVVFHGHTAGLVSDVRSGQPSLFFPHKYRLYPVSWTPSTLGLGVAHLNAAVYYQETPDTLGRTVATASVLVISPKWFLAVTFLSLLLLLLSLRRVGWVAGGGDSGGRRHSLVVRAVTWPTTVYGAVLAVVAVVALNVTAVSPADQQTLDFVGVVAVVTVVVGLAARAAGAKVLAAARSMVQNPRLAGMVSWMAVAAVMSLLAAGGDVAGLLVVHRAHLAEIVAMVVVGFGVGSVVTWVGVAADQDLAARSSSDSAVKTVAKVVLLAVTALVLAVVGQLAAASTLLVVGAGAAVVFAGFVVSARREVGGQRRTSHLRGLWCVALVLVLAGGALIGVAGTNAVAEGALGAGIGAGILSVAVAAVVWFRPQMLQPSPQRHSHHL